MVKASGGFRRSTRRKFRKSHGDKFTVTPYLQQFEDNQKVIITPNPSSQKTLPHRRFQGLVGIVEGKRGRAYLVRLRVGNADKLVISGPEHLKAHKLN